MAWAEPRGYIRLHIHHQHYTDVLALHRQNWWMTYSWEKFLCNLESLKSGGQHNLLFRPVATHFSFGIFLA